MLLTAIRFAIAVLALGPLVLRERDHLPSLPGLTLYATMGLCLAAFFGPRSASAPYPWRRSMSASLY
jgi:hypothetical protein